MKQVKQKLTLDRPASYQITVPGHLDARWTEWDGRLTNTLTYDGDGTAVTILNGLLDQAALQGLLRRLYALGLPLMAVLCVETDPAETPDTEKNC